MKRKLSKHTFFVVSCFLFVLMACSFGGCDCSEKCSGCSHLCHECETCYLKDEINDSNTKIKSIESKNMKREKSDSGLEWEVLQKGTGDTPQVGKTVTVHYTGWLNEDGGLGKKFDSSLDRGQKFSFKIGVGMVIAGWDEGVMGMKVGEKRRLFIPADLGYGSRGAGNVIPPNSSLIFDVELFDIL